MCISGNAADKIPAVICNEVSLVKVLADAVDEVDAWDDCCEDRVMSTAFLRQCTPNTCGISSPSGIYNLPLVPQIT